MHCLQHESNMFWMCALLLLGMLCKYWSKSMQFCTEVMRWVLFLGGGLLVCLENSRNRNIYIKIFWFTFTRSENFSFFLSTDFSLTMNKKSSWNHTLYITHICVFFSTSFSLSCGEGFLTHFSIENFEIKAVVGLK